jgi:hypothetical protein
MKSMCRSVVFLVAIGLIGIMFIPAALAETQITKTASLSYQHIIIDTGFPKLTISNYSLPGYHSLVPQLYTSVIQNGGTQVGVITIDTGLAPIIPTSYLKPQSTMQIPDTNQDIFYPECQSVGGLTNNFGLKGGFSYI